MTEAVSSLEIQSFIMEALTELKQKWAKVGFYPDTLRTEMDVLAYTEGIIHNLHEPVRTKLFNSIQQKRRPRFVKKSVDSTESTRKKISKRNRRPKSKHEYKPHNPFVHLELELLPTIEIGKRSSRIIYRDNIEDYRNLTRGIPKSSSKYKQSTKAQLRYKELTPVIDAFLESNHPAMRVDFTKQEYYSVSHLERNIRARKMRNIVKVTIIDNDVIIEKLTKTNSRSRHSIRKRHTERSRIKDELPKW